MGLSLCHSLDVVFVNLNHCAILFANPRFFDGRFGLAGLVLAISFLPRLFAIDVAEEAQALAKQRGMEDDAGPGPLLRPAETPSIRAYRIENSAALGRRFFK